MKNYTVITTAHTDNSSDELKSKSFETLEYAESYFNEELKIESEEHGVQLELSIYYDKELIKSDYKVSKLISNEAIIVTYQHVGKGMNYAYKITYVEKSYNKRYCDLCANKDQRFSAYDTVFDNIEDLIDSYENGYGIMGKLNKGRSIILDFLSENNINGYNEEQE
jgi:PDZ domain-containing secreted protein